MKGDGQLVKDSILKNKILKYYNPTHTPHTPWFNERTQEAYQNTKNTQKNTQRSLSKHLKHTLTVKEKGKERKRDENTRSCSNGDKSRIVGDAAANLG